MWDTLPHYICFIKRGQKGHINSLNICCLIGCFLFVKNQGWTVGFNQKRLLFGAVERIRQRQAKLHSFRIVMAEGPEAQGQPTLLWFPKASLLCGTQVARGRIDGGVGQLRAVSIRPYYQEERVGFNQKRFLFGAAKPSHKRQAKRTLRSTFAPHMEESNASVAPHMEERHSFTDQNLQRVAISAKFKNYLFKHFLVYDLGNHF